MRQARERGQRRQDRRMLQVVNTVRGALGADMLSSLWGAPAASPSHQDQDAVDALKYRWSQKGWFERDATC
jgi:hypothetical protein